MNRIEFQLKNSFDKYYHLPIDFWAEMVSRGTVVSFDREEILKSAGSIEKYLYFIISGSGGILLWNNNNYLCTDIVLKNDFFCDYFSFITRQPTPYEVIVFDKSELFKISYDSLHEYLDKNENGDKFWRYAAEALYLDKHLQFIQSATKSPEEIYTLMQSLQPDILQVIPQKYIASYLGITPQSMSRIRKRLMKH